VCFQNIETQYYTQLVKLNPPDYIEKICFSCAACVADDGVDDYVHDPKAIYEGIMPVCIKCKDLGIYGYRKESKVVERVLAEEHHGEKQDGVYHEEINSTPQAEICPSRKRSKKATGNTWGSLARK
jgi:hypothetical protein